MCAVALPVRIFKRPWRATAGHARGDVPVASSVLKISHDKPRVNDETARGRVVDVYQIVGFWSLGLRFSQKWTPKSRLRVLGTRLLLLRRTATGVLALVQNPKHFCVGSLNSRLTVRIRLQVRRPRARWPCTFTQASRCRGPGLHRTATGRADVARGACVENSDSITSSRGTCGEKEDDLVYGATSLLGEDGDNGLLNVTGHSRVPFLDVDVHFTSHAEFR